MAATRPENANDLMRNSQVIKMQADMSRDHSACESIKIVCTVRLPYLLLHSTFFSFGSVWSRSSRWVSCAVAISSGRVFDNDTMRHLPYARIYVCSVGRRRLWFCAHFFNWMSKNGDSRRIQKKKTSENGSEKWNYVRVSADALFCFRLATNSRKMSISTNQSHSMMLIKM